MTLRQKQYLFIGMFAAGLFLLILTPPVWLKVIGFLMALAAIILHRTKIRCLDCGAYIAQINAEYCSSCGKKIDWDAK